MVELNEVVVYDARSDNLVTLQKMGQHWKVRTVIFPDGYDAEVDLNAMLIENDEYLTLGVL